jgi:hypothetical protein
MTRPDHTAVPPADVIAAAELPPLPAEGEHGAHRDYTSQGEWAQQYSADQMREYALAAIARAEGAATTAAQAAPVSEPVAYPGIEHLTIYSGQDITQNYCLQHEGRFFDVEDVQRAFAARRAAWDAEAKLGEAYKAMAWKAASHAQHATLAASCDAESATSGATSAAKVEVGLPEDTVRRLWQEAFEIALNEAGFGIGNGDVAHMNHPIVFTRLVAKALKSE